MGDELKYIDDLYKNSIGNLKQDAGKNVWIKIYWSLLWLKYRWYAVSALLILIAGFGIVFLFNSGKLSQKKQITEIKTAALENNSTKLSVKSGKEIDKNKLAVTSAQNNTTYFSPKDKREENASISNPFKVTTTSRQAINKSPNAKTAHEPGETVNGLNPLSGIASVTVHYDTLKPVNKFYDTKPLKSHPHKRFTLNIYGGFNYSTKTTSGFSSDYPDYRRKHENPSPGWSAGVELRYRQNRWSFGIGLNRSVYRQYRDYKFTRKIYNPGESYFYYDTTFIWIYDPPDLGKPLISSVDSTWIKVYTDITDDRSGYNILKYIEIPVTAGYIFNAGPVSVEISTGFTAGLLTGSHYAIPREDINTVEPVVISQMNKLTISWIASVSVYYRLNKNSSLYISPVYKKNMHSIFNTNIPVNERFKTFGLNLGISYVF